MNFPKAFRRGHGTPGAAFTTINADVDPTTLSGAAAMAYASNDNCWSPALVGGSGSLPAREILVNATTSSVGPGALTWKLCLLDPAAQLWSAVASGVAGSFGTVTGLPVVLPAGATRADAPTAIFAFVPAVAAPTDGVYLFEFDVDFGDGLGAATKVTVGGTVTTADTVLDATVTGGKVQVTETSAAASKTDLDTIAAATATEATAANQTAVQATAGSSASKAEAVQGISGGVPIPVSATSLPLPTGAAQDATLTGGTAKTQVYDGTNVIGTSAHPVRVDPTGTTTQPVSATALPQPTPSSTITQGTLSITGGNTGGTALPSVAATVGVWISNDASQGSGDVWIGTAPAAGTGLCVPLGESRFVRCANANLLKAFAAQNAVIGIFGV